MPFYKSFRLGLMTSVVFVPALALPALVPLVARADALGPEMTVTATAVSTLLSDVPGGVSVITQAQMQAQGDTTLVDALNAVPGLDVVQSGGPGGQASVFVRGSDSNAVLVLLDGVPVNDPSDANGAFNFGIYTLSDIQRIEVVRGPMSGLYGSNAIGGVINIITMQGAGKPKLALEAAGGFPAQGQGSASLTGRSGKFDYALSGAVDEEAGFDYTARRLSAYAGNRDPYRSRLGALNVGYSPVAGTRVSLVLRAQQADSGFPGSANFDDPNNFLYDTNLFGKFGVDSNLFNGLLSTQFFVGLLDNELRNSNLLDAADPNAASANDHYHGRRWNVQWNNVVHVPDYGQASLSSVLFGVEYTRDSMSERTSDAAYYGIATSAFSASLSNMAGHLGAQTTLFHRLTLTVAGRDDASSGFGNVLTGRVGAVLAVPQADMRLKASYGTGFLAPSLIDLYGVSNSYGVLYQGNPHLKPEHSAGFDAGAEFTIPAFGRDDGVDISASYFLNNVKNQIETVYNSSFTNSTEQNVNRARINGVEAALSLHPAAWFSADVNYTYTNARDLTAGTQLLRRPENTGSLSLTFKPLPNLSIVPKIRYIGRFNDYLYDNSGNPAGNPLTGQGYAKPGTIADLTVNYAWSKKLSLFAVGRNLFQSKFEPVNGLQIPGQSFLFGLRATVE